MRPSPSATSLRVEETGRGRAPRSSWRTAGAARRRSTGGPHQPVQSNIQGDELAAVAGEAGLPVLSSVDGFGRATVVTFAPAALGRVADEPVPIVASEAFLEASASTVGDEFSLAISGIRRAVRIVASVRAFPATDPTRPVAIVDLATLGLLRLEGSDAVEPADEWWLAVDDGGARVGRRGARRAAVREPRRPQPGRPR